MRKTIYLVVLLAALTGSAYAGDMPQPAVSISEAVVQGDMNYPLTGVIVTVLETALSLI
jgi:hypothetical protein